mgnify:CR=1 FL=1
MEKLTLSQIAQWSGGRIVKGQAGSTTVGVSTDTRAIAAGSIFVALVGDRYDAHDFIDTAIEKGAKAIMVSNARAHSISADINIVAVEDTLTGLQNLACGYRESLNFKTVAITGSNGKTSTKEFTAAVLGQKFNVLKTEGNLNNHIGVPLMMLRAGSEHTAGVFEVGMNHPGELQPLVEIVKPIVGVVTNVGPVHIEHFENEEAIAVEKGTVARCLGPEGVAVLNADDKWFAKVKEGVRGKIVTVGIEEQADFMASDIQMGTGKVTFMVSGQGKRCAVEIPVVGKHMVYNALLAIAVGASMGVSLEEAATGLKTAKLPGMRLQEMTVHGVRVINDAYNANPHSMKAAIKTLADLEVAGQKIIILGEMRELGTHADSAHVELGQEVAKLGIDELVVVGGHASEVVDGAIGFGMSREKVYEATSISDAAERINNLARPGDVVLFKASRGARLEEVLAAWQLLEIKNVI